MNTNRVALQFGNGSKTHIGTYVTFAGRTSLFTSCGSRKSGTAKSVMGDLDLATFASSEGACEKCAAVAPKLLAQAVAA